MAKGAPASIYTDTGAPALVIEGVRRRGSALVIEGKALGSMYMDMVLTPKDFVRVIKVMSSWALLSFVLLLPLCALRAGLQRLRGSAASPAAPVSGGRRGADR
jgi:hypothetical protein